MKSAEYFLNTSTFKLSEYSILCPFLSHSNVNGANPDDAEQKTEAFLSTLLFLGKKKGLIFGFSKKLKKIKLKKDIKIDKASLTCLSK